MLYNILYPLSEINALFNIFKYITFRAGFAAITSFFLCIFLGPGIIAKLGKLKIGENIMFESCPQLYKFHSSKQGTPTMGGIIILISILVSVLLWADLGNKYILLSIFVFVYLGILGALDDYLKLKKKSNGLRISSKLIAQIILGLIIGIFLYFDPTVESKLYFPYFKNLFINFGIFYILFNVLVIVGSSNAVNLADGLDGLATGCMIMVCVAFCVLTYISGHLNFSKYLLIPYIEGSGELSIFCSSILGACMGFLWFNCYPATVFMGDVGSLTLGGTIGAISVFIKKEITLLLAGGIFVIEALSVILQIVSFRLRGKRIFKIAPLHHHFQMMGWPESKVIVRFWILGAIFALLAIVNLKIR